MKFLHNLFAIRLAIDEWSLFNRKDKFKLRTNGIKIDYTIKPYLPGLTNPGFSPVFSISKYVEFSKNPEHQKYIALIRRHRFW